jgi:hypothetical protein
MALDRVSKALGERFSFSIVNAGATTVIIALLAGFLDTLKITAVTDAGTHVTTVTKTWTDSAEVVKAGYACDCVLDDGVIYPSVTATASNSKMNIRQFVRYIKSQPRVLVDLTIQASSDAAFNAVLEVAKLTPLQGSGSQTMALSDFLSVDQQSTNKINITGVNLSMMYDTLMLLPVYAGHTLTFNMKFS